MGNEPIPYLDTNHWLNVKREEQRIASIDRARKPELPQLSPEEKRIYDDMRRLDEQARHIVTELQVLQALVQEVRQIRMLLEQR